MPSLRRRFEAGRFPSPGAVPRQRSSLPWRRTGDEKLAAAALRERLPRLLMPSEWARGRPGRSPAGTVHLAFCLEVSAKTEHNVGLVFN